MITAPEQTESRQDVRALRALFADDEAREAALDPIAALYRGEVPDSADLARIYTDALQRERFASARRSLALLAAIDRCALTDDLRLSHALFGARKAEEVASLRPEMRSLEGAFPFHHFAGLQLDFPSLIAPGGAFPYENESNYREVLRLYAAFPTIIDTAITRFRAGARQGVVLPRLTVEHMVAQIDALLDGADPEERFLTPIEDLPPSLSRGVEADLVHTFTASARTDILPAYRRLRAFLAEDYLPAARPSIGLSDMPGGAALYRALIARETSLALDPDDIHALGTREVARIETQMAKVARDLGSHVPLPEFFENIRSDPRFHPRSSEDLPQRFGKVAATVDTALPRFFRMRPESPLQVQAYPPDRARYEAGGSYVEGSGKIPATFFYNTYDLKHRFVSGVTTLYLHEAMPGHHLQISLARENSALPAFQRNSQTSAFVEGWALYAETLGYDMGLYDDPLQHWGTLDDEMLRAMRLVVDTGIHARHWSRAQAIDYMLAHSGMGHSDAEAEVDRYSAMPAQALSYKIGALTIQKLRRDAEQRLGPRFDIRDFHEAVLGSGALPLGLLQEKVERWVATQEGSPLARHAR
ncbi:DUF885 domain-containing protein [Novosphingobium mangrovi (ex Hu et al. 2023)]|uniref:DUF885 domain-containing protein n=1 Tax=Novosphingobium mangrovi (ex Hu et al. 2023) TaxID=2930094 RepID=A0ABT0AA97_9SPHN|nr:DUF885 domain-containing protein [Novosphingobium mangrovi (ex Hu et al. 2023)]MCJ1960123.1 DUF885 domain-containing protein [Novosphingobium mangrovi (ex Hu et al. 2023)]